MYYSNIPNIYALNHKLHNRNLRFSMRYIYIYIYIYIYLVCSSDPLDTLIMFTTTINVSNRYSTNIVVVVPIIWLYITVVVVVI